MKTKRFVHFPDKLVLLLTLCVCYLLLQVEARISKVYVFVFVVVSFCSHFLVLLLLLLCIWHFTCLNLAVVFCLVFGLPLWERALLSVYLCTDQLISDVKLRNRTIPLLNNCIGGTGGSSKITYK